MPERDSSGETSRLSQSVVDALGIDSTVEDIYADPRGLGCYQRRDEAIRQVFPEYGPG